MISAVTSAGGRLGRRVVRIAPSSSRSPWDVDFLGARRLAEAVDRETLRHLVYVSIVGVERIPVEYYHAKFAAPPSSDA